MKKYQIIYCDPPWRMTGGELLPSYNTMTIKDIVDLPIREISQDNSALFLWALNTRLAEAIGLMIHWGFVFKAVAFCWIKTSRKTGMPNCRLGSWTLNGMELCLLGIKGKMKRKSYKVKQVIMRPRGRHSAKPPEIRNEIVKLFGDLPRIELFARKENMLFEDESFKGWDVWGNEVKSDIVLTNQ